jgi:murein DD-endopeptidase MepM/ murein hydrolase activator NlpD
MFTRCVRHAVVAACAAVAMLPGPAGCGSCSGAPPPARDEAGGDGNGKQPPAKEPEAEPTPASGSDSGATPEPEQQPYVEHEIQRGQTLWAIARAYGVSVDSILKANDLRSQDARGLHAGEVLEIPGATEVKQVQSAQDRTTDKGKERPVPKDGARHEIAKGETLWDVARLYDKTLDELLIANDFSDSDARSLRPGDSVVVPGVDEDDIRHGRPKEPASRGLRHTVRPGETIWDLAHAFHVSVSEIMTANGMSTEEVKRLRDGATLIIPGVTRDDRGEIRRRKTPRQRRAMRKAKRIGLGSRRAAKKLLHGRIKERWVRAAGGTRRLPGTLRWPVTNGWFVRGYGSGAGSYHLAVDIMGEIGWNVRAAARGIVGYAGDGLKGYGNVVMVVHPGGWVTMYAHNSANFVVAGQRVPRGAILAEVGTTGITRGPHVHFELIYDHRNCDPAHLFRPGIRHKDGDVTRRQRVQWRRPGDRPAAVQCAPRRRHPDSRWN